MRVFIFLTVLLGAAGLSAKEVVRSVEVSPELTARIRISQSDPEAFWKIQVVEKKSRRVVAQVDADPVISPDEALFVLEDFNFDGIKDLAVIDGHKSCYGSPTYVIFLGHKNSPTRFRRSPALTDLAHTGCGLFEVDQGTQRISVRTKSGCCQAMYYDYRLPGEEPVLVRQKDAYSGVVFDYPLDPAGKQRKPVIKRDPESGVMPGQWFSFKLKYRNARVAVFAFDGDLNYALINEQGEPEFMYPQRGGSKNNPFKIRKVGNNLELAFANSIASYSVYLQPDARLVGVRVIAGGKHHDLQGDHASIEGDLAGVLDGGRYANLEGD